MKTEQIIICLLSLYLFYILFMKDDSEGFALSTGIITDKTTLDPTKFYQVGTLNSGIVSTITDAVAGGKACDPLPQVVYRLAVPTDATCTPQVDGNYTFTSIVAGSTINPKFFSLVNTSTIPTGTTVSWMSYNSMGVTYVSSGELIASNRPAYAIFTKGVYSPNWVQMTLSADRVAVSSGNFQLACTYQGGGVYTANELYPNSIAPAGVAWNNATSVTLATTAIDVGFFPISLTAGGNTLNQQQFTVLVQAGNPHLITFGRIGTQWTSITNLPSPSTVLKTPITDLSIDGTIVSLTYYTASTATTPSKTQMFYADFSSTYVVTTTSISPFTPANLTWKEIMLPSALKTAYVSSDFKGFGIKEDGTLIACKDVRTASTATDALNTWFTVSLITPGLLFKRVIYRKNDLNMVLALTSDNKLYADFNASGIFA
jgi:hypothetical protein